MPKPVQVRPLKGHRLWIRYDDGAEGEVDLSHLVGKGVFRAWSTGGVFESVRLAQGGGIEWDGGLELCPDAIYLKLTGKTAEQLFPGLRRSGVDA